MGEKVAIKGLAGLAGWATGAGGTGEARAMRRGSTAAGARGGFLPVNFVVITGEEVDWGKRGTG